MNLRSILISVALLLVSAGAWAQDLKPVKDKSSKLFGYQDKSKNWVIPPAYSAAKRFSGGFAIVEQEGLKGVIDQSGNWILKPEWDNVEKFGKSGLCEVTRKEGKTKYRGVANSAGELVIPAECLSVNINQSEGIITAQTEVEIPRWGRKALWGVYDAAGDEIFEPQFASAPSWHNGKAIAKSASNGLYEIIDSDGKVLLPPVNLAISTSGSGFEVLSSDFVSCTYDSRMFKSNEFAYPGYVAPYDPEGDVVRAIAWHAGPIGARLHRNNLKLIRIGQDARGRRAECEDIRLDWGFNRFVRLEPFVDEQGLPGSMLNPENNTYYTVKAILYEADGRFVQEVSRYGWLEAECADGFIYNAEGVETWIALKDINCLAIPAFSLPLTGYKQIDHGDILAGLGLRNYELGRMYDPSNAMRRYDEIREAENVGITSYLPRPAPDLKTARTLDNAMRSPLFRQAFGMGQVVNCKVKSIDDGVELDLSDRLVCHFEDEFKDPRYYMKGDEEIFWGPNNARTVRLLLEETPDPKDPLATKDDIMGSERSFAIVIALFEEDGRYLRTLAVVPSVDYASDGTLVFENAGIVIIGRNAANKTKMELHGVKRLPATLSALTGVGESFHSRPGGYQRAH